MSCDNDKRTYISAPIKPGFAQLPDVPKNNDSFLALKNFLQSVKNVLEGTTPNNPVIPYHIEHFIAATTTTGVRLTWDPDKNSAFYVVHRNNTNNFDQSRIVFAGYADHGKPSFFDVGGQDDTGAPRFYWIRGYGPTGNAGILTGPLVSRDPGIFAETEMIGPLTGTLITLSDNTTKAVEDLVVGDQLLSIDPEDVIVITEAPTPETKPCVYIRTMTGKNLTIPLTQLVHEYDGGQIPAIALAVGNEIRTIDGNEVITEYELVGDQVVWRVRLNKKYWYPADRIWLWALGTQGDSSDDPDLSGYTGPSIFQLVTRGIQSNSLASNIFNGTLQRFDGAWFTGPNTTFVMRMEVENAHPTLAYNVIVEDTSGNLAHTQSIPANTAVSNYEAAFVPLSGERTYRVRLDITASNNQLKCYTADIYVNCVNEPTPVFQVCFDGASRAVNETDLVAGDSRFTAGDSGLFEESNLPIFFKDPNAYFEVDHCEWHTVMGHTGLLGTNTTTTSLVRRSDDTTVVANTSTNGTPTLVMTDFSFDDINFDDGEEFSVYTRMQTTFFANTIYLKSYFLIFYSDFRRGQVWLNTGRNLHVAAPPDQQTAFYVDATVRENSPGTELLRHFEYATYGGSGTTVPGADLDPAVAAKTHMRTSALALATGPFYSAAITAGTGSADHLGSWLLFSVIGGGLPGEFYYRMQRDFHTSESDVELSFRIAQIGESSEDEQANLDANGKFRAEDGYGILGGNDGVDADFDPRLARRVRVDKGIVTLVTAADDSSDSDFVHVASDGALDGDGTLGDPLAVRVDNITIGINVDNELQTIGHWQPVVAGDSDSAEVLFADGDIIEVFVSDSDVSI